MAAKTIVLKGRGIRFEAVANAAITPGHLVELMSTGKIKVHATAGGNAEKAFAVEDDSQGQIISHAYEASETVQYEVFGPGCVINALIKNGQDVDKGDLLESGGDGTLQVHVPDIESGGDSIYSNQIIAVALEDCDMSGSSAVDPSGRCAVRII